MTTCIICVENFNQTKNKIIKCLYCQFEACRSCCEKYLLDEDVEKCMSPECGKTWPRQFMNDSFTNSFITGQLKKHKEDVLLDKEKALFPATQAVVEEEIRFENLELECKKIREQQKELQLKINQLTQEKYNPTIINQKKVFVRACPSETCNGFLDSHWNCGLCNQWTCSQCHIIKGKDRHVEHTCHPDDVATAKLIASDTKPCPTCKTGIFKIDGCDQMWCTQCKTAFSWKTGKIETKIHNPHYFQYLRTTGGEQPLERNPQEVLCGREIDRHFIYRLSSLLNKKGPMQSIQEHVLDVCRFIIHINQVEIPRYTNDGARENEKLRVNYMRNKIDETSFKKELHKKQKLHEKNKEICDLFVMFNHTTTDIIYRYQDALSKAISISQVDDTFDIIEEIQPLVKYVNECFTSISTTYKCVKMVMICKRKEFCLLSTETKEKKFQKDLKIIQEIREAERNNTVPPPLVVIP